MTQDAHIARAPEDLGPKPRIRFKFGGWWVVTGRYVRAFGPTPCEAWAQYQRLLLSHICPYTGALVVP